MHCTSWLAQCNRWDFLQVMGRVHRIWWSTLYILFIYIWSKYSALVQVINYQLFDLHLSLELKTHNLETNSHFTPELLFCTLGDLTISNLLHSSLTWMPVSKILWSVWKFLLFIYFSSWIQGLLVLVFCPSPYVTSWVLHVAPAFQELAKQTIISFVGCSHGFQLKDLWSNYLLPFH